MPLRRTRPIVGGVLAAYSIQLPVLVYAAVLLFLPRFTDSVRCTPTVLLSVATCGVLTMGVSASPNLIVLLALSVVAGVGAGVMANYGNVTAICVNACRRTA